MEDGVATLAPAPDRWRRLGPRRPGRRLKGALIGTLAGAVVGGVIGYTSHKPCDESKPNFLVGGCLFTRSDDTALGAIALAPVGAVVGALVAGGERWEVVDSRRVRVSLTPVVGNGVGARVALSF